MKKTTGLVYQHLLWRGLYILSLLIVNIGIARFFAAEQSGRIFFIVNNLAFVLLIVSVSLESGSTYYLAAGELEAASMARFCMYWAIGASLVAVAGWWGYLELSHSPYLESKAFIPASFLFIIGVLFTTYFTALFYAGKEFGIPNKILLFVNLLIIAVLIACRKYPGFRIRFMEIYFFGFFLQGLLLVVFFFNRNRSCGKSRFPTANILSKLFRYSLVALLANGIYFLVNRIDYWFVKYYCSAADLGNYIQASKLAQLLLILPSILASTLFPVLSSSTKKGIEQPVAAIRILLAINGIICICIACLGWYWIPLIFGSSYKNTHLLFVLLIPGILSITMTYPMTAWFSAGGRVSMNLRGSLIALTVICAGDIICLPLFGVQTAAIVCSAGYFCYYCYMVVKFRQENRVGWKELLWIKNSDMQSIKQSLSAGFREPVPENPVL